MAIVISGFSVSGVNGIYTSSGNVNGYPVYVKDENNYLVYKLENGPYSFSPAYYLVKVVKTGNSVPICLYCYKAEGSDLGNAEWVSLRPQSSGENEIGELDFLSSSSIDESTSSSSSSSGDSSDSS